MESSNKSRGIDTLPNIPSEIMTEILLYLPVKSLLKFRSVCKSWLSLISSSQFIKTHLNNSTKSRNYSFILNTDTVPTTYYTCSLSSILCNTVMDDSKGFDLPFRERNYPLWFAGSCNGLLCISINSSTLVLYNPSIRKFKTLPDSGTEKGTSLFMSFGFCYDQLNDDYKVVELNTLFHRRDYKEVKVYSLRNDSWRRLENDFDGLIFSDGGINVGGILHWFTYKLGGPSLIFAVNTVTYRYDTLAPPKQYDEGVEWSLGELDGCLGVFYGYYKTRLDVWVMTEYGVKESWTKLLSIAHPGDPRSHLHPLLNLETLNIFLYHRPYMMLYISKNNSFTTCELHSVGGLSWIAAPPYIESLVSPSLVGE